MAKILFKELLFLFFVVLGSFDFAEARGRTSSSRYSYSRYSYGSSYSSSTYSRYTYRYSSSYDSYRATSIRYTPTTYTYSYSYYTGLYYSYYYYTYYSYYYGSTCTRSTSGSYSVDSCSSPTTTTAAPTPAAPAPVSCTSSSSMTSSVGYFNSHTGYGTVSYVDSMYCTWSIVANAGNTLQLSFVTFATEKSFDQVRVFDGTSSSATLLGTFHGTSSADPSYPGSTIVYSSGRYLFVTFNSDSSITKTGFSALYQQVSAGSAASLPPATASTASTATTAASSFTTQYCSGQTVLSVNSTSLIVSHSGRFGQLLPSPTSGLGQYMNSMNCSWVVPGLPGYYLTFYVTYMNLESCYDKLSFYRDMGGVRVLMRTYCDASTPVGAAAVNTVPVTGLGAIVIFTTDSSVTRQGFILTYAYVSTFTSDSSYIGNTSHSTSPMGSDSSTTNNVCRNYAVNMRGTAMGSFTCPNPFEPSDFTQCCGSDNEQYCCKLQDNTPMLIGCIVGSIVLLIVIIVVSVCCCRSCRETQAKKSDTSTQWRRSMNKARAVTAWKRLAVSGSTASLVPAGATEVSARPGPSSRSNGRYANLTAAETDGPTFTPPPVPPPSALYFGGGGYAGYGGFAPAYPTAPPPAYDTAYPPQPQAQPFRM